MSVETSFESPVLVDVHGQVAVITLNRPARRNAIDAATCRALRAAIDRLEQDESLAVGILCGAGPVFCAGMDLLAFANGEAEEILFGPGHFAGLVSRERKRPLIAAVQGAALAGGFELALACDMIIAAPGSQFGLPEAKRGLIAGAGGAFRLGQRLPPAIAREMVLTGDPVPAERALQLGLINRIVPAEDVLKEALDLAGRIAANAPLSLACGLQLVNAAAVPDESRLWAENDRLLRGIIASADAQEGAAAFAQKRAPQWQGR
ncbi:crotonase/enoyl-CoA hydratase family protein [Pseudotabrizicola sp. 4114]|uniref:crotonase/enoyl-CoA hydratase family protein n=1 Tax=Pseudotabrizicola sp. 4114 TaxID=2817731 RepID=UPI00285FEA77|nr:enoyl-CoA hydratase/carnithine racemase [Pseudorhodobacter sp. 4114]